MASPNRMMESGRPGRRRTRRRIAGALLGTAVAAVAGLGLAPVATAAPYGAQYVKSIRCDSPNPWPGAPLRILVDVYTSGPFPTDGLPGPAITLSANNPGGAGPMLELTSRTTVRWKNATTGRTGTVVVPLRAHNANWEAVLHPGRGRVSFTIRQQIGALAFNPMVNPQYSSCRGSTVL